MIGHLRNAHPVEFLLAERLSTFLSSVLGTLFQATFVIYQHEISQMMILYTKISIIHSFLDLKHFLGQTSVRSTFATWFFRQETIWKKYFSDSKLLNHPNEFQSSATFLSFQYTNKIFSRGHCAKSREPCINLKHVPERSSHMLARFVWKIASVYF